MCACFNDTNKIASYRTVISSRLLNDSFQTVVDTVDLLCAMVVVLRYVPLTSDVEER